MVLLKGWSTKYMVGLDLGNQNSQISYSAMSGEEVRTLSLAAGEAGYHIPTLLCKRRGMNQWLFGREALQYSEEEWIPVDNLLELARKKEEISLDGEAIATVSLLALYIKRCLGLLATVGGVERMEALMITCPIMDACMLGILKKAVEGLELKTDKIYFQGYMESFYQYVIHQPPALWERSVLLLEYEQDNIWVYRMDCNRNTSPVVVLIDKKKYLFFHSKDMPHTESMRREREERMDEELVRIVRENCTAEEVRTIFLIGEDYDRSWMKQSLGWMCRDGRRVFQGSNLYSKGACLSLHERLTPDGSRKGYVYLGQDKLKANIGMRVVNRGKETYMALLDGGSNWFEAEEALAFYVREDSQIELLITPLTGQEPWIAAVELEGRTQGDVRIHMHLRMVREDVLRVTLTEHGFGDMSPATYREWRKEIPLFVREKGQERV